MKPNVPAVALLIGALGLAAAGSAAALERAGAPRGTHPAVLSLLESAEQDLNAGRPERASVFIERALRIEPRNPTVWHYLGLARLEQGDHAQAEAMAAKSHSLAAGDRALRERNVDLTVAALEASGRPVAEMNDALQRFAVRRPSVAEIAPASRYAAGDGLQRFVDAAQQRVWPRAEASAPGARSASDQTWRNREIEYRELLRRETQRVRREAKRVRSEAQRLQREFAARGNEIAVRSFAPFERRQQRRRDSSSGFRPQR